MKIALNIIIAFLIFLIMADIESNSNVKNPNYSDSILYTGMLIIFGFIWLYYPDFKKLLLTKK